MNEGLQAVAKTVGGRGWQEEVALEPGVHARALEPGESQLFATLRRSTNCFHASRGTFFNCKQRRVLHTNNIRV